LQIETLTDVVEANEKKSRRIERIIKNTRVGQVLSMRDNLLTISLQDNWEPALEKLVQSIGQRFSRAFDRKFELCYPPSHPHPQSTSGIRCAGEVRVSQHEDYDKWAIDILVKFRDRENLQLLTGQRQSGGVSPLLF
jgi:hypothetical protein